MVPPLKSIHSKSSKECIAPYRVAHTGPKICFFIPNVHTSRFINHFTLRPLAPLTSQSAFPLDRYLAPPKTSNQSAVKVSKVLADTLTNYHSSHTDRRTRHVSLPSTICSARLHILRCPGDHTPSDVSIHSESFLHLPAPSRKISRW